MWGVGRVRSELCATRMSRRKKQAAAKLRAVARSTAKLRAVARNFEIPTTPANDIMDNERGRALKSTPQ
jgi:hypothetical protein